MIFKLFTLLLALSTVIACEKPLSAKGDKEMSKNIQIGDAAPLFVKPDMEGNQIDLASYRGKSAVVLYFYPKNDTPGCTAQACKFRDSYELFVKAGAVVIGVSGDSDESHKKFSKKHRLPFTLISDKDGELRKLYGVPKYMGVMPGRVTYVIDKQGNIKYVHNSMSDAEGHIGKALEIIAAITEAD